MTGSTDTEDPNDPETTPIGGSTEDPEEVEESTTSATDEDEEDQPPIEDDEFADLDAIAEDVQEASTEDADSEDAEDRDVDESDSSDEPSRDPTSTSSSREQRSWGKMYRKGVVKTSEALIDEFGDEGAEPITEADVQDMELDEAFNEWMEEKTGRPEDIPPGQWVLLGTLLLVGGNALTETDLAKEALSDGI